MVDNIINVKILLSNGKNWVIPKEFIHSLQRKHNFIIIQLKDPKQHSYRFATKETRYFSAERNWWVCETQFF